MRAKLVISYDGSKFCGFARQKEQTRLPSVSDTLEAHLASCGIFSKTMGAGRTDAGVHATRQCVAFDLPVFWDDAEKLKFELVRKLPSSIQIRHCEIVTKSFNPRFDAKSRAYRYIISKGMQNPFYANFVHCENDFNLEKIQHAIETLNGTHDFAFFKKTGGSEANTIRALKVKSYKKNGFNIIHFESSSFLRSQIRLIISFLLEIFRGNLTNEQLVEQLSCEKKHISRPANASGLYLVKVSY
jgi:tRNA pseudouridine38-40 synthase